MAVLAAGRVTSRLRCPLTAIRAVEPMSRRLPKMRHRGSQLQTPKAIAAVYRGAGERSVTQLWRDIPSGPSRRAGRLAADPSPRAVSVPRVASYDHVRP